MVIGIIMFLTVAAITAYLMFTPKESKREFSKEIDDSKIFDKYL